MDSAPWWVLQAAAALADMERQQRAAAAGEAETLRADAERRAKAFNAAVAAAVGRVRVGLEAERDSLAARHEHSSSHQLSLGVWASDVALRRFPGRDAAPRRSLRLTRCLLLTSA